MVTDSDLVFYILAPLTPKALNPFAQLRRRFILNMSVNSPLVYFQEQGIVTPKGIDCLICLLASVRFNSVNKKHLKNVGPIRNCEPFYIAIHQVSLLSHAACASMSTTTTTTRDRGDRYGPIEWAQ